MTMSAGADSSANTTSIIAPGRSRDESVNSCGSMTTQNTKAAVRPPIITLRKRLYGLQVKCTTIRPTMLRMMAQTVLIILSSTSKTMQKRMTPRTRKRSVSAPGRAR